MKQRTPCGSHWCPWLSESHEATQRGPGRWNPDCGFASQPGNPGPGNSTSLVASLPLSPRETALCPRPIYKDKLKTQPRRGADRLPPGPPSLWLHPSLPAGLTSGQQRPGLNPGGLLPSGLRAARQVQAAERGPHRGRSAPWPGLRPPGPTTACRPPADLSHPPQGPQRSPPAQADPCPPPHHRPCLQTWGNSGSRPGSVKLDSDVLAHWCG